MSNQYCYKENDDDCILNVLRKIAHAQQHSYKNREQDCNEDCTDLLYKGTRKDTIPFMLYCKGNCEPFEAMGNEFCTIFFRVCNLGKKCVTLELLRPDDCYGCCRKFPKLCRTGECLTFHLDCFCGIQCLKPF